MLPNSLSSIAENKYTVLFDLDGTLLDTLGDLAGSVNFVLSGLSFPLRTRGEIRSFIGNGVPTLMWRSLPAGTDENTFSKALAAFTAHYMSHICVNTVPYQGISETLSRLKKDGFSLGVVSNKKHEATVSLCEKMFPGVFGFVKGASSESERKPRPDMIFAAMERFGTDKIHTLYVGDSNVDIETAANAGIRCISATWGYRGTDELKKCGGKIFASDPSGLYEIILTLTTL